MTRGTVDVAALEADVGDVEGLDEVDAVVAVHMFGNLCDMPGLRKAAPGKSFIEDCAQALGSRLGGRPASD